MQRVVSGDKFLPIASVISEVPQFSIVGPLPFVLFTPDNLNNMKVYFYSAYNEDTQLTYSSNLQEFHLEKYIVIRELNCEF